MRRKPVVEKRSKRAEVPQVSTPSAAAADGDRAWSEFVTKYAGHPGLQDEAVYAMPEKLIDAVKLEIKGFFTPDEESFERDLTQSAGAGFFLGRSFGYPSSPRQTDAKSEKDELTRRTNEATICVREMLVEELKSSGCSQQEIDAYFAREISLNQRLAERQWGYAGWLVTSADFRRSRDEFRRKWETTVHEQRDFPGLPLSFTGNSLPVAVDDREFFADYTQFYCMWSLDRLVTWELPVPMRAELATPSLYPYAQIGSAGVLLFAPWHLLRDQDLKVRELVEHKWMFNGPRHMQSWVEGKPKKWGHDRYAVMLRLFVYLELVLKRRYPERIRRKTEKLDSALGRFLCKRPDQAFAAEQTAETIRKIRQEMNRRLKES